MNRWILALLLLVQLSACGGGGGHSSTPPPASAAPSDLSYPSAPALVVNVAMTALTPAVTGTVVGYTVSPSLPAGLALDASSGVISGTPTVAAAKASYTVTASNASGSTTASVSLQVNDVKPMISYPTRTITLTTGAAANIVPTSSGGAVVTWTISPALPAGLTISATTGAITGTPTAPATAVNYTVTAQNSGGSYGFGLQIQVVSKVLLDLGHSSQIRNLVMSGTRLLSQDQGAIVFQTALARCNLWNATTDALIAAVQCRGTAPIALAGTSAVVVGANGLSVLAAADGHVLGTITAPYTWWQLASDGSYVVTGGTSGLTAFSPAGAVLFSASGDYSQAKVFAAPSQIQIALGPKGASVIETIAASGGTSSTGPAFNGTFNEWFADGARFQTTVSTSVYTYSAASVQQDLTSVSGAAHLGGTGNWFYAETTGGSVSVYKVGASTSPALTVSVGVGGQVFIAGTTLALQTQDTPSLTIVDLSGTTLAQQTVTLPLGGPASAYAAASASAWFVGIDLGVVLDGPSIATTAKYLSYGAALSFAGGGNVTAVATASGQIVVVNTTTKAIQNTINFPSSKIQMSTDGTVLAAMGRTNFTQYLNDESLKVYSLPSGTVINTWPYTFGTGTQLYDFSLAGTGTLVGQVTGAAGGTPPFTRQVTAETGGAVLWSDSQTVQLPSVVFSPDGTLFAAATGLQAPGTGSNIYQNYVLSHAVTGWPVGWTDNTHLLTNLYVADAHNFPLGAFSAAQIFTSAGSLDVSPPLPELTSLQVVSATNIYSPSRNSIYAWSAGTLVFGAGDVVQYPAAAGAVAGGFEVFASADALLLADQY